MTLFLDIAKIKGSYIVRMISDAEVVALRYVHPELTSEGTQIPTILYLMLWSYMLLPLFLNNTNASFVFYKGNTGIIKNRGSTTVHATKVREPPQEYIYHLPET